MQKSLVIVQITLSVVLVSGSAMLAQTLLNLEHQNFGFETQGRYIASINPKLSNYQPEQLEPLFHEIDDALLQIPGVRMAAPVLYAPMTGDIWGHVIRLEGRSEPPANADTGASWARVMPGFFDAIGAKIIMGRPITDQDTAITRNVAVINQAFAKRFFGNQNPIGQHFGLTTKDSATYEIVGVTNNIRYLTYAYKKPVRPMFWVSEAQTAQHGDVGIQTGEIWSHYLNNIVIWAPGKHPKIQERVQKALASVDPNLVLYWVDPYSEVVSSQFQQEKMIATLTMLFAALGLVLAAVGLYGVLAYTVERRTGEIGMRMALGADRSRVIGMVLWGACLQVGLGLGLGIPAAVVAGKLIATRLFGIKPWDPLMLALAVVLLGFTALLASLIPALRAAGVEPMVALRTE